MSSLMKHFKTNGSLFVNSRQPGSSTVLARSLVQLLDCPGQSLPPLTFVCIGSTKILTDCMGPIIGTSLVHQGFSRVYGTLEAPIHACNLSLWTPKLTNHKGCTIAIDAALGTPAQSGHIVLGKGPLYPGEGLGKTLSPLGDIHILGIFSHLYQKNAPELLTAFCRCILDTMILLKSKI